MFVFLRNYILFVDLPLLLSFFYFLSFSLSLSLSLSLFPFSFSFYSFISLFHELGDFSSLGFIFLFPLLEKELSHNTEMLATMLAQTQAFLSQFQPFSLQVINTLFLPKLPSHIYIYIYPISLSTDSLYFFSFSSILFLFIPFSFQRAPVDSVSSVAQLLVSILYDHGESDSFVKESALSSLVYLSIAM